MHFWKIIFETLSSNFSPRFEAWLIDWWWSASWWPILRVVVNPGSHYAANLPWPEIVSCISAGRLRKFTISTALFQSFAILHQTLSKIGLNRINHIQLMREVIQVIIIIMGQSVRFQNKKSLSDSRKIWWLKPSFVFLKLSYKITSKRLFRKTT